MWSYTGTEGVLGGCYEALQSHFISQGFSSTLGGSTSLFLTPVKGSSRASASPQRLAHTPDSIQMEMSENKGVYSSFFFILWASKSKQEGKKKPRQGYSSGGSRSKRSSALLTTQAGRSLKDYTADCQRGVQSSGLRKQRIRVQGPGVSCPTPDKTAARYINHRGGGVHTTGAETRGHPRHFIYPASSPEGLHRQSGGTTAE